VVTQHDVYQFYNETVKPLYCEIEAQGNDIPVELLFETYAAFDHLKRIYIDGEPEELCCKKALSHLKRGALDVLKLKLKYLTQEVQELLRSKGSLKLIDNGQFLINLTIDRVEINTLAKQQEVPKAEIKTPHRLIPGFRPHSKLMNSAPPTWGVTLHFNGPAECHPAS